MAEASKRATTLTTLVIEKVEVSVGLFTTVAKPAKIAEFQTAGPSGGVLLTQDAAREKPLSSDEPMPERVERGDPLGADPGSDAPPIDAGSTQQAALARAGDAQANLVPGEIKRVLIEEGTGQTVERADVRKGIRHEDGSFTDLTGHLEAIEAETKLERMEVVSFIDVGQIERARVEASYYVGAAEPKSAKPLRLIYEAMKLKRRVAVVKWSSKSRQSLGVLTAHGKSETLVLLKLAWAEDWREPPAKAVSVARARVSPEEIDMAARLIEAKGDTVDSLDELRDDALVKREELREKAERGEVEPMAAPPVAEEEIALEDAFEASLAELLAPRVGKG